MEKTKVHQSNLLIVFLIFGLLVGQSTAVFTICYAACFIPCVIQGEKVISCAAKCLAKCIFPTSLENLNDTQDFCKLGCVSSKCINLSTKDDPAAEKVESCVDSCSKTCTKI